MSKSKDDRKWHFVEPYTNKRNGKTVKVPRHGKCMPKKR